MFFQLITNSMGQISIIITSNKGPGDWGQLLGVQQYNRNFDRIIHEYNRKIFNFCLR